MTSRRFLTWAWRACCLVIITGAVAAIITGAIVPRAAGATPYAIMSGSMKPTLPVGTLVVTRPVEAHDISQGDVITFQLRSGEPEVATHRVISSGIATDGTLRWRTQGDANSTADASPVRAEQVKGELWYAVPGLGYLSLLLGTAQKALLVTGCGGALLVYAIIIWALALRERRIDDRISATSEGNTQ